jgi:signal transduction histidine kinase
VNILNLSKLENQEIILEKKRYRLDEQLRQAVLQLESEWSAKDLQLEIDLSKTFYNGNERLMMQVWTNLIGNAIKFTPCGGTIGILLNSDSNAVVTVTDTGCGMDENIRLHMFDKFYQGDTARKSEGYGLGLALVKRIVDLCQGSISVNSDLNKGSEVTVSLPLNDI